MLLVYAHVHIQYETEYWCSEAPVLSAPPKYNPIQQLSLKFLQKDTDVQLV